MWPLTDFLMLKNICFQSLINYFSSALVNSLADFHIYCNADILCRPSLSHSSCSQALQLIPKVDCFLTFHVTLLSMWVMKLAAFKPVSDCLFQIASCYNFAFHLLQSIIVHRKWDPRMVVTALIQTSLSGKDICICISFYYCYNCWALL